jgi:transposase-like protein
LRRPYWSADDARVVLTALDAAGIPVTDFARTHDLDPQRLYAWRRRLHCAPSAPPERTLQFVQLPKLDDRMMDLAQSFIREHTGLELRR